MDDRELDERLKRAGTQWLTGPGRCDGCRAETTRRSLTRWTAETGWQWGYLCEACAFGVVATPAGTYAPRVQVAAQAVREALEAFPVDPKHEGYEKREALEAASHVFSVPAGEIARALRAPQPKPEQRAALAFEPTADAAFRDDERAAIDAARLELLGYALDGHEQPPESFEPPAVVGWVTEGQWWLARRAVRADTEAA
jgi:hypothetical protein